MKKAFIFIFVSVIILTSCSVKNKKPEDIIELPMKITAMLQGSKSVFTAEIFENSCDVVFDEGHALAGTKIHFGEEGNTATVGGFTREVKSGIFPAQETLIKALRGIYNHKDLGIETDNGIKYTIDEMTIMVYYDRDAELLTAIRTEEGDQRFDFTVVKLELYEEQSNGSG